MNRLTPVLFIALLNNFKVNFVFTPRAQAHAGHVHAFGEDNFTLAPKKETHPLTASNWSSWAPAQIDDGSIDIVIDKTMPRQVKRIVREVLRDVRSIIGTKVTFKNGRPDDQRCIGRGRRTADMFFTDRDTGESWDQFGGIGDDLDAKFDHASGLAFVTNGCDGSLPTASWKTDIYFPRSEVRPNGRVKERLDIKPMTKQVITHEILHVFGLSHPNNVGSEPGFTWTDTAMSYNPPGSQTGLMNSSHITDLDREALNLIWG